VKLFELAEAARKDITLLPEAQRLQGILACADYTIAKSGIAGTKFLLIMLHEYGGLPRKPLPEIEPEDAANLWAHPHTKALFKSEQKLCGGILKA
jgi:4-hydroxy-2-oxoglutarate aldolase